MVYLKTSTEPMCEKGATGEAQGGHNGIPGVPPFFEGTGPPLGGRGYTAKRERKHVTFGFTAALNHERIRGKKKKRRLEVKTNRQC